MKKFLIVSFICSLFMFLGLSSMQDEPIDELITGVHEGLVLDLEQLRLDNNSEINSSIIDANKVVGLLKRFKRESRIKGGFRKSINLSNTQLTCAELRIFLGALRFANYFKNIRILDLSNNNITCLPIDILRRLNLLVIDLRGNPLLPQVFEDKPISEKLQQARGNKILKKEHPTYLIVDNECKAIAMNGRVTGARIMGFKLNRGIGAIAIADVAVKALAGGNEILKTILNSVYCGCGCCGPQGCTGCKCQCGRGNQPPIPEPTVPKPSDAVQ